MDSVCFEIQLSQVDIWTNCFCILPANTRRLYHKNNSSINTCQPIVLYDLCNNLKEQGDRLILAVISQEKLVMI